MMTVWAAVLMLVLVLFAVIPLGLYLYLRYWDVKQKQHSVLRNYPVLGKIRYILENIGPELRQYLFNHDTEGRPFSRVDYLNVVMPAKYIKHLVSFGSKRNFDEAGFYIRNALFPKQMSELRTDQASHVHTKKYKLDREGLFTRKEHSIESEELPWLLHDDDAIVIGPGCREPYVVKGLVGMSGMSYGSLGERAITALSLGLGRLQGTWMNTGEGGISDHHLKGNVDLIMQIGPGLFGVRTPEGEFNWEELRRKSAMPQVKAFELKLGQGAKVRGGHLDGKKVTEEIARIRGVTPFKTIDSPNRFRHIADVPSLFEWIEKIREVSGKPVGIKIVVGGPDTVEELADWMKQSSMGPDFITVDGGEGGTGATYPDLADSVGLPLHSALAITDRTLRRYGVRNRVKLIASGRLFTSDRIAVALGMGADLANIARGFMITVGCIGAQKCHTNQCPVGVATTDPQIQKALAVEEKNYRVTNYVLSLREGLFHLAAAAGLHSPVEFGPQHIIYKNREGRLLKLDQLSEQWDAGKRDDGGDLFSQAN